MKKPILIVVIVVFPVVFAALSSKFMAFSLSDGITVKENTAATKSDGDLPNMDDPRVLITKSERKLEVFDGEKLIATYKIGLGFSPVGDKEIEGDGMTPEGEFYIFTKNPQSNYYLSLGISYPNIEDAKRGLENKLITQDQHDQIVKAINEKRTPPQKTKLGGEIYIHGNGSGSDWTLGCVALNDTDMKALFDALAVKTPVRIVP